MSRSGRFDHVIGLYLGAGALQILAILLAVVPFGAVPIHAETQPISLQGVSDQGTFIAQIQWFPSEIGKENKFILAFRDNATGTLIEDVHYDWQIDMGPNGTGQEKKLDQNSTVQFATFTKSGSYTIRITNIEGLGEDVIFPVQVTPETPNSGFDLFAPAAVLSVIIALSSNKLFRRQVPE